MSPTDAGNERLIEVTEGNLRESQLYITPMEDWLPPDCVGDSMVRDSAGTPGVPVGGASHAAPRAVPDGHRIDPIRIGPRRFFRARGLCGSSTASTRCSRATCSG